METKETILFLVSEPLLFRGGAGWENLHCHCRYVAGQTTSVSHAYVRCWIDCPLHPTDTSCISVIWKLNDPYEESAKLFGFLLDENCCTNRIIALSLCLERKYCQKQFP